MADSVFELLQEAAAASPDRPAVTYQDESLSWQELESLVRRAAGGLVALGIEKGDRVAFWLPNTAAYVVLYFACVQIGAIAVAVNTRFRAKEVADIVGGSRARALVLWPGFRGIDFLSILEDIPGASLAHLETIVVYGEGDAAPLGGTEVAPTLEGKAVIGYRELVSGGPYSQEAFGEDLGCNMFTTSGTTSAPKLVVHTHRSITTHARELWENMAPLIGDGALLQTLPFCGVFGFTSLVLSVAGRAHMVVTSAFDPAESVRFLDQYGIRYVSATDDMLMAMLDADSRERALPGLVCAGFGAFNASPEEMATRAEERGVTLIGLYGMSEVMALFARRKPDEAREQRVLGGGTLVSSSAHVRVRDPETGAVCADGVEGEIEIKGPSLMSEYFENPEATAAAFTDDGYLRTGDMGYTTGARDFVYLARMGDTLRLGGFLVSPVEIEGHLAEHPSVAAAQVVAVRIGDATRAFAFVLASDELGIDEGVLQTHCASALARFKVPVRFVALDEFPTTKSANGTKIQRAVLREWAQRAVDESS
jgi:fatty-acyl-CoA synthase